MKFLPVITLLAGQVQLDGQCACPSIVHTPLGVYWTNTAPTNDVTVLRSVSLDPGDTLVVAAAGWGAIHTVDWGGARMRVGCTSYALFDVNTLYYYSAGGGTADIIVRTFERNSFSLTISKVAGLAPNAVDVIVNDPTTHFLDAVDIAALTKFPNEILIGAVAVASGTPAWGNGWSAGQSVDSLDAFLPLIEGYKITAAQEWSQVRVAGLEPSSKQTCHMSLRGLKQ